jgi:hypothetical protein
MQYKINKGKAKFTPVDVTLTFETQDELDAMASLFNVYAVDGAIGEHDLQDTYKVFTEAGGDCNKYHNEFLKNIRKIIG